MKKVLSGIAVLTLALSGMTALGVATGGAAQAPAQIVATPNSGLATAGVVAVTGSGLLPSTGYDLIQCIAGATTEAGCATGNVVAVTTDISGNLPSTNFTVATGAIGDGFCGTSAINDTCVIEVVTVGFMPVLFQTFTTISFAKGQNVTVTPATGLTNGSKVTISGSGFTAGDSVYILECPKNTVRIADCDTNDAATIPVGPTGALIATPFTVKSGWVGSGTCGTSEADLNGCYITVGTLTNTDQGYSPLVFSAPVAPKASKVTGTAVPGATKTLTITGKNFTNGVAVSASAGTTASVISSTATTVKVSVKTAKSVTAGAHSLSLSFAGGYTANATYSVK